VLHARGVIVVVNVVGVPIDALVASTVVVPVAAAVVIGILVVSTVVVASYVVVASVVVVMTATAVRIVLNLTRLIIFHLSFISSMELIKICYANRHYYPKYNVNIMLSSVHHNMLSLPLLWSSH